MLWNGLINLMKLAIKRSIKPKIKSKKKSYHLKDSAIFKLSTKKRLSNLLNNKSIPQLETIAADSNYRVFNINKGNSKLRQIQAPKIALDIIQTRIASLLVRIKTPDYLHSGVKGKSHVTNAKVHIGIHPVLTLDIKNYYPSVSKKSIYHFFTKTMNASPDVAGVLAEICSYKEQMPTGSRLSMILSFWANIKMFSDLDELCDKYEVTMSVYVDDLTFSGENVNKLFQKHAIRIIKGAGLSVHPDKTRLYNRNDSKLITGVILNSNGAKVRNKHHYSIYELINEIDRAEDDQELEKLQERIIGRLYAAGQIEPKFKQRAKSFSITNQNKSR